MEGTFMYIGATELIVEEFSISKDKWIKLLFYIIGLLVVAGAKFLD